MATTRHIAVKRQESEERIAAAVEVLGERFGVAAPAPLHPAVRRDANLARVAVQEQMADLLEAIVAATAPTEDATVTAADGTATVTWETSTDYDFGGMKRAELDGFAAQWGVEKPDGYRTKADLIAAIEARIGQANDEGTQTDMGDPKQPQPADDPQAEPRFDEEPRPADGDAQGDGADADARGNDDGID